MIDPDEQERVALLAGGRMGGEYLESIAATDMAMLDEGQWFQFLRCVVGGYQEAMLAIQQATDGLPHDNPPPF